MHVVLYGRRVSSRSNRGCSNPCELQRRRPVAIDLSEHGRMRRRFSITARRSRGDRARAGRLRHHRGHDHGLVRRLVADGSRGPAPRSSRRRPSVFTIVRITSISRSSSAPGTVSGKHSIPRAMDAAGSNFDPTRLAVRDREEITRPRAPASASALRVAYLTDPQTPWYPQGHVGDERAGSSALTAASMPGAFCSVAIAASKGPACLLRNVGVERELVRDLLGNSWVARCRAPRRPR